MSSMSIVFPGQGSQSQGMLHEIAPTFREVSDTFEEASGILSLDLWEICQNNPNDQLNQTEFTQPILLTASVALWRVLQQQGDVTPYCLAGHSLGEYSALVCANVVTFEDALHLVRLRGRYMQEAVPQGVGAMAAIIGLDNAVIQDVCAEAAQGEVVSPANYNAIGQTVVAGHLGAVNRAIEGAKQHGAKIAKLIPVSVPSHCALMAPAAARLAADLQSLAFCVPNIPVIQNVDVTVHDDPAVIKGNLVKQLDHSVRWVETIQTMAEQGVETLIECGPGKVLAGLVKRIDRSVNTLNIDTLEGLTQYLEQA